MRARLISVLSFLAAVLPLNALAAPPAPIPQNLSLDGYQQMPSSGEKKNIKLIGYNDLQGRETLQVLTRDNWAYVGHHGTLYPSPTLDQRLPDRRRYNPLTQAWEFSGTTILNISDPSKPRIVAHIPSFEDRNCRSVGVVHNFMNKGRDYLVRNSEGATAPRYKFEIFDITNRAQGIGGIFKVGEITGTPLDSCQPHAAGQPCGGQVTSTAHKGYLSKSGFYYAAADEPGFRDGLHLLVYDLRTALPGAFPSNDKNFNYTFVGRGWILGQKLSEPAPHDALSGHHAIVDEENNRVYMAYLSGGDVVSWDISVMDRRNQDPNAAYPLKWHIDLNPPGKEAHTVTVIKYDKVPEFNPSLVSGKGKTGLPRLYAMVSDEATGDSMWRFTDSPPGARSGVREKITMLDVTFGDETGTAMQVSSWQVPQEQYIVRGGRFGPHQFNETVNGELNKFENKLAFVAYFNAGVRAIDITDPYRIEEVGHYVPQENVRCNFVGGNQPAPNVQTNDVEVDYRGFIVAPDRVGCGLWILQYTKP